MKILLTLLMVFVSFFALSEDSLTIVAVGEAEQEADKVLVIKASVDKLKPIEQKALEDFYKYLESDFAFYKNRLELKLTTSKLVDKKSYKYVIETSVEVIEKDIWLNLVISNTLEKKKLLTYREKVWISNMTSFAHNTNDSIYQAMTGKKSIFKSKIIFVSDRTSRGRDIRKELYIMDFDGGRKQRLTFKNSFIFSPSISPDQSTIVFTLMDYLYKKLPNGKVNKIKNLNLYSMDVKTRKMKLISSRDGINSGATFDHSGENIYMTLSLGKNADIYKMNLKTKKLTRVTSHFAADVDPHVNATGDLMTFLSGRPGKAMIYTKDPRGLEKDVKRISFVGDFNAGPRFNREGTEIAFSSWVDNRFDIYRIGKDGRNLVRLTKNFGSNEEPWFSPDGEFIVFSSQRVLSRKKAVQDLYIMTREGEIIKKITTNYGKSYTPRWSN